MFTKYKKFRQLGMTAQDALDYARHQEPPAFPKYLVKFRPKVSKHDKCNRMSVDSQRCGWGDIKAIWHTDAGYIGNYRASGLRPITDNLARAILSLRLRPATPLVLTF